MNYPQAVPQGRDVAGTESCCECVVQVPAPPSNGLPDMVCAFGSSNECSCWFSE